MGFKTQELIDSLFSLRLDYDASNNLIFLGKARPGNGTSTALPVWQITAFTYDGSNNLITLLFADGNLEFDNVYDDRASLSYS